MIAIKRRCKFFDRCEYADETSRTCTQDSGGDYCVIYRALVKGKNKKMQNKDEKMADLGLKQLGVNPQIYHFTTDVKPFTAITIAANIMAWATARRALDEILHDIIPTCPHEKATRLRLELAQQYLVYGVSICDTRDSFNRQRGRTIAKGRLLKRLKQLKERRQ